MVFLPQKRREHIHYGCMICTKIYACGEYMIYYGKSCHKNGYIQSPDMYMFVNNTVFSFGGIVLIPYKLPKDKTTNKWLGTTHSRNELKWSCVRCNRLVSCEIHLEAAKKSQIFHITFEDFPLNNRRFSLILLKIFLATFEDFSTNFWRLFLHNSKIISTFALLLVNERNNHSIN